MRIRHGLISVMRVFLTLFIIVGTSFGNNSNFQISKLSLGSGSKAIAVDDFDNDSDLDIANLSPDGIVRIHQNDGNQQFASTVIYSGMVGMVNEDGEAGTADFDMD